MSEPARVLGIDPGTRFLGYGVVEGGGGSCTSISVVRQGVLRLDPRESLADRFVRIFSAVDALARETGATECAIEAAYHGKSPYSALRLGEARGVAIVAARRLGLPVFDYPPAQVKRCVAGSGRAHKTSVRAMVGRLLNLGALPASMDAADALAVALCHIERGAGRAVLGGAPAASDDSSAPAALPFPARRRGRRGGRAWSQADLERLGLGMARIEESSR